jgi:hypothetical protein
MHWPIYETKSRERHMQVVIEFSRVSQLKSQVVGCAQGEV